MTPADSASARAAPSRCPPLGALAAILQAGVVAGTLDLLFAWVVFPAPLLGTLKVIAGGWFGPAARGGGAGTAVIGFVSHYAVAVGAAGAYWLASRLLPWLDRHAISAGLAFGAGVYEFMHLVVLPLSAYHSPVRFASLWKSDVLSHLFLVGLPIALIVRRHARRCGPAPAAGPRPPVDAAAARR